MRFVISLLALMLVIAWDATANETDAPRELWIDSTELLADQDTPRFCVQFNRPIDVDDSVSIDAFVRIEPESDTGISARRNLLCIDGLNHGGRYTVRLLEGLPGIDARLMSEQTLDVVVPNREPVVEFPSGGYVLPAVGSAGIPVETVNVETLALKIYRVNDRSLADELRNGLVFGDLYDWTMGQLADQNGELVWQGEVDITNEPEQRIRTAIPVAETIGSLEPGIYAAAAVEASVLDQEYYWYDWATQWFVVSDLGLTAMIGETGLHATARALSTGEPLADVAFELIARNNAVLVIEQSDADGLAAFDPGFARGQGGNAPRVLIARLGDDFAFLDLETAPMDLSDRGVEGRLPPEALDAFVYTERGIYRPGETVHVVALLRNSEAMAVQDVGLTLRLLRPDGVEAIKDVVPDNGGGSHPWAIVLPGNAYTGSWTLQVLVGDGDPVGSVQFLVEDFVPPRIEFELSTDPEILNADDDDAMATVDAGYLYGGQAAGLTGEASFSFDHARDPFSRDDGYEFGLIEEDLPVSYDIASFTTDAAGDASFPIWLDQIGNVTSPIDVTVHAQIFDVGGRPVGRNATMTVLNSDTLIGIKPLFAESTIRWGEDALFEIAAYGSNGERLALDGLQWNLVREDYDWRWYDAGWRWEYQGFYWDEPIASGSLDALCDDATVISQSVTWGRFRLEVYDPATGAATSVRFRSGWRSTPNVADAPPDRVTVTVSDAAYKPGDTATLFIDPPFDARVALAVMDDGVRDIRFLDIPEAGAEVELKVDAAWTPGVYVVATAYGAPDPLVPTIPQRALGLAWVEVDLEGQRLDIGLVAPELIEPETTLTTTVTVEGAGDGEEVFVTLAAVDDGVLQLTRYAAPDPQDYFLGQRSLGVAIRDLYGRLIDSSGAISGIPRQGGDALQGGGLAGALPKRSSRVVALFSGVLPVIDGTVEIPLDVPDFNGRLRVMAVAWSPRGTGQAETTVQVSAPIIADLSLPRFLAPGDLSTATLAIDNLRAPEGSYEFFLTAEGAVEVLQPWGSVAMLNAGEQARSTFRLETKEIGTARIELVINPPEGDSIVRSWDLSVRPSTPLTTTRRLISIPPGTSYLVPTADTQGYYADGLTVSLTADSTPPLDTVQLLRSLYLYPYGCAEQTTSRAMPLLYAASLPGAEQALDIDQNEIDNRLRTAIRRLSAMQTTSGNFGLWNWYSYTRPWLDAYVMDFLSRARELGHAVPEQTWDSGMRALEITALDSYGDDDARAYAVYVLARNGWSDPYDLAYVADNLQRNGLTTISQALVAATFANLGDMQRGLSIAGDIEIDGLSASGYWFYGSPLRDSAMVATILIESGLASPSSLLSTYEAIGRGFGERRWTSTQENAWLVMAAHAARSGHMVAVSLNGETQTSEGAWQTTLTWPPEDGYVALRNEGDAPLFASIGVSGYPLADPVPEADGFEIWRYVYDRNGVPLGSQALMQNDLVVVVVAGRVTDGLSHDAMVVDLLPAGLELENARLEGVIDVGDLAWLGELTWPDTIELRDDRFVAAFETYDDRFRFAYLARAVTPGTYSMPPPHIEDMYRPYIFARGEARSIVVTGP